MGRFAYKGDGVRRLIAPVLRWRSALSSSRVAEDHWKKWGEMDEKVVEPAPVTSRKWDSNPRPPDSKPPIRL